MRYADWKAVYIDKTKTLEDWRKAKDAEYKANNHSSGALGNILNNKNDTTYEKRDKVATDFYNETRQNKDNFIKNISQNGYIHIKSAEKIFEHIFIKKHNLNSCFKTFDTDYNMAESFKRIIEGINIQPHNLILLKHERLELYLMTRYKYDYSTAHKITERKCNLKPH